MRDCGVHALRLRVQPRPRRAIDLLVLVPQAGGVAGLDQDAANLVAHRITSIGARYRHPGRYLGAQGPTPQREPVGKPDLPTSRATIEKPVESETGTCGRPPWVTGRQTAMGCRSRWL